jgi:uncharacterized protein YjbI with pentapeptide repeats
MAGVEISQDELKDMLAEHDKWVKSRGKEGQQANITGATALSVNLEGADLKRAILSQVDFFEAKLANTKLFQADLHCANLHSADLQDADLRLADLRSSNLGYAEFGGAKLLNANLRNAALNDANLSKVSGLQAGQLAGTNLSNAKLPDDIEKFRGLKQVEENSKHARNIFLAMISACVYVWLTIATTTDAALLTNSSGTPLPIINASIPIAWFFLAAPMILLVLYFYQHVYLQSMWDGLGELPAIFPDGRRLEATAYPWLLTSLVTIYVSKLNAGRTPLTLIKVGLSVLAAWFLVPVTLWACWLRYLPRHDWIGSAFLIVAIAVTSWAGISFFRRMKATLAGTQAGLDWRRPFLEARVTTSVLLVSLGLTYLAIGGPVAVDLLGFATYAELTEVDVSTKPANLSVMPDITDRLEFQKAMAEVIGAKLRGADLRFSGAKSVFLAKADLKDAEFQRATLDQAKLQGANLESAKLRWAKLRFANLQGANLRLAHLNGANLSWANLHGANLEGTILKGANFEGADLRSAYLQGAKMAGVKFAGVNFSAADLRNVSGLTRDMLVFACGDLETKLPRNFEARYRMKACRKDWEIPDPERLFFNGGRSRSW